MTEGWVRGDITPDWHYVRDGVAMCGFYETDLPPDPTGGIEHHFEPNCDACVRVRLTEMTHSDEGDA